MDMRLDAVESTKIGMDLVEGCKTKEKYHAVLAVSGAGKTRSIFDIAMHDGLYVMYMECKPPSASMTGDSNFVDLYEDIVTASPINTPVLMKRNA